MRNDRFTIRVTHSCPIAKKSPVRETAGSSRTDQGLSRGIPYRPFGHLGGDVVSEGIGSAGDLRPQMRERHYCARGDQGPGNRVLDHRQALIVLQKICYKLFHSATSKPKTGVVNVMPL